MELAAARLFRAKWTDAVHEEWIRSLLEKRTDLERSVLEHTRDLMNEAVPDATVEGYEDLIEVVTLPDKDDRHVLAAAIRGRCAAIITFNLKDFPATELAKYDIEAQHPDEFINHQFGLDRPAVVIAAQRCRGRLKNPPISPDRYLELLAAQSLPKTASELLPYAPVL